VRLKHGPGLLQARLNRSRWRGERFAWVVWAVWMPRIDFWVTKEISVTHLRKMMLHASGIPTVIANNGYYGTYQVICHFVSCNPA
jgi:hypothetical protein